MTNQPENRIQAQIFDCRPEQFEQLALDVFEFQYNQNDIYKAYCNAIGKTPIHVDSFLKIPFLPIQFFKTKVITSGKFEAATIFESSRTTGSISSKHYIKDLNLYEESFIKCFDMFYGDIKKYCILGLLPSYLERSNASLVYMVDHLIKKSEHPNSGFYLNEYDKLAEVIKINEVNNQQTLLIGVSYALLAFAEKHPMKLSNTIVMETGGMKGRREEITKEAMHTILKQQFEISEIHSEYGMTELLSQAYSKNRGIFTCPTWMKILIRPEDNPLEIINPDFADNTFITGVVNIIDLANLHSCSFIATDDVGKVYKNGDFEILGRLENSDIRGCGLMII